MLLAMGGESRPAMGIIPPEMTRSCPPALGIDLDDVEDVLQTEEYWGKKRGEIPYLKVAFPVSSPKMMMSVNNTILNFYIRFPFTGGVVPAFRRTIALVA